MVLSGPCAWGLSGEEFEGVLHPVFAEDELTLILAGHAAPPDLLAHAVPVYPCSPAASSSLACRLSPSLFARSAPNQMPLPASWGARVVHPRSLS